MGDWRGERRWWRWQQRTVSRLEFTSCREDDADDLLQSIEDVRWATVWRGGEVMKAPPHSGWTADDTWG
jgi:hypothetical protein